MICAKYRYSVTLSSGSGSFNTDPMYGIVEHLMIVPASTTNVYDVTMTDRDGDVVYRKIGEMGRMDDKAGLPIGRDSSEKLTVAFANATSNEAVTVIFKVREKA